MKVNPRRRVDVDACTIDGLAEVHGGGGLTVMIDRTLPTGRTGMLLFIAATQRGARASVRGL